jgi:hypothetical protein
MSKRAERHNEDLPEMKIKPGMRVWLYVDKVKTGFARKLAHMWHGPFLVKSIEGEYMCELDTEGTGFRFNPKVHISKLKPVRLFPDRPTLELTLSEEDRFDFDEALLPEDSWEPDPAQQIYEVETILERRIHRPLRLGRRRVQYKVKWKGYDETSWVNEEDLNCGGLIYDFLQKEKARCRFEVMQAQSDQ